MDEPPRVSIQLAIDYLLLFFINSGTRKSPVLGPLSSTNLLEPLVALTLF